ncbi:MAG: hypothetical protein ACYSU0_05480, partial [Planctomycetota bacterium]
DDSLGLNRGVATVSFPIGNYKELRQKNLEAVHEFKYPIGEFPQDGFEMEMHAHIEDDYALRDGDSSFGSFKREQVLALCLRVKHMLPGMSKDDRFRWFLDYLCIDWPFERAWALGFTERETDSVGYDPELHQLVFVGRESFEESDPRPGWDEYWIYIGLKEPCRVYDVGELRGQAFLVATPPEGHGQGALSGLRCRCFASHGEEVHGSAAICRNGAVLDFTIDVPGISEKRRFWVERHLTFDGVIPEAGRFSDISQALQDAAINLGEPTESIKWWIGIASKQRNSGKGVPGTDSLRDLEIGEHIGMEIKGEKRIGGSPCKPITVKVAGEKMEATRQLALAGGGFTQATIKSGKIEIDMTAMHDDFKELNRLFDQVEATLRERLDRFRIL